MKLGMEFSPYTFEVEKGKIAEFAMAIYQKDISILCTECSEPYEPISGYTDMRCTNCGNHQSPI